MLWRSPSEQRESVHEKIRITGKISRGKRQQRARHKKITGRFSRDLRPPCNRRNEFCDHFRLTFPRAPRIVKSFASAVFAGLPG
jgi:hypothetical protein